MSIKSANSTAQHTCNGACQRHSRQAGACARGYANSMHARVYTQHTCIDHAMSTRKGACQQHTCGGLCRQSTCKGHHSQRHTPYMQGLHLQRHTPYMQGHHSQRHKPYMQGHMQTVYMQGHMQTACSIHAYMQALTGRGGACAPGLSAIPVQ